MVTIIVLFYTAAVVTESYTFTITIVSIAQNASVTVSKRYPRVDALDDYHEEV